MLRIAIPNKGRLADDTRRLLDAAGLAVRLPGARALAASLGGVHEAILVRARDIPDLVADGFADAGITGYDVVAESGRDVCAIGDLGFGHCRLVVAATVKSGIADLESLPAHVRVASSFPRSAARFFADAGRDVTIVPVSGAAEISPHLGIADVIVDLVSTGSTLRANGLREVATILESSARLIARADAVKRRQVSDLADAIDLGRLARVVS